MICLDVSDVCLVDISVFAEADVELIEETCVEVDISVAAADSAEDNISDVADFGVVDVESIEKTCVDSEIGVVVEVDIGSIEETYIKIGVTVEMDVGCAEE